MSNAEPFTTEELDTMRQELAASDSLYLRVEQPDRRWLSTIAALFARVAKLEEALRDAQGALHRAASGLQHAAAVAEIGSERASIHRSVGAARRAAEAITEAIGTSESKP